ncbi:MAG: ABC transporter substrate-binding protein [Treponemataceae bacterium]|nr:ABC transporter substrate-binding protein [Treponemataceae bacterium]
MEYCTNKILKSISLLLLISTLSSCSIAKDQKKQESEVLDFKSIEFSETLPITYARYFSIKRSGDCNYSLVSIQGEKNIIIIEENKQIPANIPSDYVVLQKPLNKTYLVSSSVMDFLLKLDVLDRVKFSGTKKENWYLDKAINAMEKGSLVYAGKYSAPDYELLYSNKTDLSIQNTMIYHKPEVKEKLEQLGIPVLVEKSSYEKNPLGKIEWIKLYGLLFDREKEAAEFFNSKIQEFSALESPEHTDKTIAFFYITSNGTISVRKPGDYIAESIKMAGGKYFLESKNLEEENALSSMIMQSEDFYLKGRNADILVYNSTIDGMITEKSLLLAKYPMIKDFSAFKNNKIYCTDKKFFQETSGAVDFMTDLNKILKNKDNDLKYLVKIQ